MSTDAVRRIDEAREALRETVARLAEIADGLRGEPESQPELPPEPPIGSAVFAKDNRVWQRCFSPEPGNRDRTMWFDVYRDELTWAELNEDHGPLVRLVRADQTVVLPSEFPAEPVVEWAPSGTSLNACVVGDFDRLKITIRHLKFRRDLLSALIPLADAERWALEVIALVRSKGGGVS